MVFNPQKHLDQVLSFNHKVMNGYVTGLCKALGLKSSFAISFLKLIASSMSWYLKYNISPRVFQATTDTSEMTQDVVDILNYHSRKMGSDITKELYNNPGKIVSCALAEGLIPVKQLGFLEAEPMITKQTNEVVIGLFSNFLGNAKNKLLPAPGTLSAQLMKRLGIEHTPVSIEEENAWKDWFINGMCESAYTTGYIPTATLSTVGCNIEKLTTRSCIELGRRVENIVSTESNIVIHNVQEYYNKWLKNIQPQSEYIAFDLITIVSLFFIITSIISILFKTTEVAYGSLRKQASRMARSRSKKSR
jgi:hypothetical protein